MTAREASKTSIIEKVAFSALHLMISAALILSTGLQHRNGLFVFCGYVMLATVVLSFFQKIGLKIFLIALVITFIFSHLTYLSIAHTVQSYQKIALNNYFSEYIYTSKFAIYVLLTMVGVFVIFFTRLLCVVLFGIFRKAKRRIS